MIESEAQPEAEAEWYEPWQPQIGQRVRIRLSGECPLTKPEDEPYNGTLATVVGILADGLALKGHRFVVKADACEACRSTGLCEHRVAALEVEPVQ